MAALLGGFGVAVNAFLQSFRWVLIGRGCNSAGRTVRTVWQSAAGGLGGQSRAGADLPTVCES